MFMGDEVRGAADLLRRADDVVVLTGAGVSTESGIPDFRSPGGIWDRFDPSEFTYQNYVSNPEHRKTVWQLGLDVYPVLERAQPNPAHLAVTELERRGKLRCLVTQNIDGLHQKAGTSPERTIEIHGTAREVTCLSCGDRQGRKAVHERLVTGEEDPPCRACGGILKPATISFGQAMPEREMMLAFEHARRCRVFLVIGSSLVVYPVASLPAEAVRAGAQLLIVNREPTPYDSVADAVLHGSAGETMEALLSALDGRG